MFKWLLSGLILFSLPVFCNPIDCRDINGDLIPDCTCTNAAGEPISCTDGTLLYPPPVSGGGFFNPGNDGIDNDGDGLTDEADEQLDHGQIQFRSGSASPKLFSFPTRLSVNSYPLFIKRVNSYVDFDTIITLLWSGDKEPWVDTLDISLYDGHQKLREHLDYEVLDLIPTYGGISTVKIKIRLFDIYGDYYRFCLRSEKYQYSDCFTFFLVTHEFYPPLGPSKRIIKNRRIH